MSALIEYLNSFLQFLISPIYWAMKKFFYWMLDIIFEDLGYQGYSQLVSMIPDMSDSWDSLSIIRPFVGFVDTWIPLDTAFLCLNLYFQYIITMITVKLVIKLFVPTVG